jgi:membrane-bound lytic murein transglycosylase D
VNYVPKLIAVKNIVLAPATYGVDLGTMPDQAYFTAVPAPDKIDVKLAAKLAGMSEEEFVALNPSNNNAVAISKGTLLVPLDKADAFRTNLEGYDKPLVTWTTVQAKKGESIDAIAQRHGVPAHQLRAANGSVKLNKKGRLAMAQSVLVPMKAAPVRVASVAPVPRNSAPTHVVSPAPATPAETTSNAPRWYTVRAGDTLFAIAQRSGAALPELLRLNKLGPKAVIQPGLKLRLP